MVVLDGMYSALGEIPPVDVMLNLTSRVGGRMIIDESHSFGDLGATGRRILEHFGLYDATVLRGGSTSKAFGVMGGIIPTDAATAAIYRSTHSSRSAAAGTSANAMHGESLKYIRRHPEILSTLRSKIGYAKSNLRSLGLPISMDVAPVASFSYRDQHSMRDLQARLFEEGVFVLHSNYIGAGPDVVIRCGIFADHTREHIDMLVDLLRRYL